MSGFFLFNIYFILVFNRASALARGVSETDARRLTRNDKCQKNASKIESFSADRKSFLGGNTVSTLHLEPPSSLQLPLACGSFT